MAPTTQGSTAEFVPQSSAVKAPRKEPPDRIEVVITGTEDTGVMESGGNEVKLHGHITWTNQSTADVTITFAEGAVGDPDKPDDDFDCSFTVPAGKSVKKKAKKAGTFVYGVGRSIGKSVPPTIIIIP